ncbi:NAD(FAD)-utilizing dehydrogenase [Amylibacter kogurei]|uniref:NAD(FAD)-utilizing dehydrogenase n=1 Tax=Paramylibacter kogurei TaxID=1889778 RepID=A0A2G5K241_9RHOB|nr:TIGR03862 family flavoprotein [Amylibacter kogurei]PIB23092.1 NAD(FAD)-utilizing dehydrogenase [Amylibacter kogurei]
MTDAVIIGAGPAGLMAAETIADAGFSVLVADAKPTFGRKFLMAGKSGLNLTMNEPFEKFISAYGADADWLRPIITDFDLNNVIKFSNALGAEVFTGSSGRVFPKAMKASPMLRAWLARLAAKDVTFQTNWTWTGWNGDQLQFNTPVGTEHISPRATVFALGGASWARLGSTGQWAEIFDSAGIEIAPFLPANMGFVVNWSKHMEPHFGQPIKPLRLSVGDQSVLGEIVISRTGLEGGGIYAVSRAMRDGGELLLDFCPDVSIETLQARLQKQPSKASRSSLLRKAWSLSPAKSALFNEFAKGAPRDQIASLAKALPITHNGPRPMDEAISSAGGVAKSALANDLMLQKKQGVFCAGEMLDWEAPTGGYLITACLATGYVAGKGAVGYLSRA